MTSTVHEGLEIAKVLTTTRAGTPRESTNSHSRDRPAVDIGLCICNPSLKYQFSVLIPSVHYLYRNGSCFVSQTMQNPAFEHQCKPLDGLQGDCANLANAGHESMLFPSICGDLILF